MRLALAAGRLVVSGWCRLWFRETPALPLEIVRIGLGLALLAGYGFTSGHLAALYADAGWVSRESVTSLADNRWGWSLLFLVPAGRPLLLFHAVFLAACAAFTLGWRTSWAKWAVLAGHLSYAHRSPVVQYGVDSVLAGFLFVLCLAPLGRAASLDRRRLARLPGSARGAAALDQDGSRWRGACVRLLQVQLAAIMFFAGVEKVHGDSWWQGYAVWVALTNHEFANVPVGWLARNFWIVNLLTYFTMFFEVAYAFLVWGRQSRPFALLGAVVLHGGMAGMMGLYLFSFVMLVAQLVFVPVAWLHGAMRAWRALRARSRDALAGGRRAQAGR
ncbi:MAG: hypothetical protein A3D33_10920 [Candidatus Rokubacteria bacterium RIFCSPHIGHO2_02_FULL_73_26]|nr:MAG: hypothetical protein A3D33_10920 [Candidatus Rokubacteria bacterium RIFCSPHIGHO2_02_FULL_73_26]